MLVATRHFLTSPGAFWKILACRSLGNCEYMGRIASAGGSSSSPNRSENKKVLLRERKRHTARHVSSAPSVVLSQGGGYLIPGQGLPIPGQGIHHPWTGGTPSLAGVPSCWPVLGYPWGGTWDQSLGYPLGRDLGPVTGVTPPERTWDQWKYYGMEMGYPLPQVWTDKQTETITIPILRMREIIIQATVHLNQYSNQACMHIKANSQV